MGIAVMVMGASGSGKSASLRSFKRGEVAVMNVAGKPLPFKQLPDSRLTQWDNVVYRQILRELDAPRWLSYVIDDSQYLMAFDMFDKAKTKGYDKFTDMAQNFYQVISKVRLMPADEIVYFLHHTEVGDDGRLKAKTLGKMLDNQLTVEGLFSIVLLCQVEAGEHFFMTNSDGTNPAKSPMGMFDLRIDNDLKFVDMTIREYYGLRANNANNKEVKTNDDKV